MALRENERGQAIQIGAVFLLAVLVIWLSIYNAEVIPMQNKGIEFRHSQGVRDDMMQVRSAILNVGGTGTTQAETVKLGTGYPARIFGVNPPPASGSLSTAAQGQIELNQSISIRSLCGYTGNARAFVYNPNYNELRASPIVYDNTALYLNNSGNYLIMAEQSFINDHTIQVSPLNASFSTAGMSRISVTFKGGPANGTVKTFSNPVKMTLPTRLPASVWETNDQLLGSVESVKSVEQNTSTSVDITLKPDTYTFACRAVGIDSYPASGQAKPAGISGGYGKGSTEIYNPNDAESETLATKGGLLKGIVNASKLKMKDPAFSPTRASQGDTDKSKRYLRIGFTLRNNRIRSSNYKQYHFIVGEKSGINYQVKSNGIQWQSAKVTVIKETDGNQPKTIISGEEMDTDALDDWVLDGEELDLLNKSNYKDPNKVDSELSEVRSFLDNDEKVALQVVEMHGRVRFNVTG